MIYILFHMLSYLVGSLTYSPRLSLFAYPMCCHYVLLKFIKVRGGRGWWGDNFQEENYAILSYLARVLWLEICSSNFLPQKLFDYHSKSTCYGWNKCVSIDGGMLDKYFKLIKKYYFQE